MASTLILIRICCLKPLPLYLFFHINWSVVGLCGFLLQQIMEIKVSFRIILNTIIRKLRLPKPTYLKGKDHITNFYKFGVEIRSPVIGSMYFEELHFREPYEAQQKACFRAIEFLRTIHRFEIEDVNFTDMFYYNDGLNRAQDRIFELCN